MQTIGALKVPRMITFASILSLGSLYICWSTCDLENPTILETTLEYPYTIIFRIGMMYSLFIFFLELFFIKWWLDSTQKSRFSSLIWIFGTVGLASYGLFVSCIDRKRINYSLARGSANLANLCLSFTMWLIMHNLRKIRKETPKFIKPFSWFLKKTFALVHLIAFSVGVAMYLGQVDIYYKPMIEYTIVISMGLFLWSFAKDFRKFKMDIDCVEKEDQGEDEESENEVYEE